MGDEAFSNTSKTEYDEETAKALANADLMNKICNDLKLQLESMFTPNPGILIMLNKYLFDL